jgi:glycosyltransferase involved in cell wall biosynthesis
MVSVIIPAYNTADTLALCLDSILNQTLVGSATSIVAKDSVSISLELILVDDGSADNIQEVINKYKPRFMERGLRFEDIHQPNQGSNPARNRGFSESRGEYVIFCDADVVMKPEMLQKMLSALESHPDASYAYSSFLWGAKLFRIWKFDAEKLKQMSYIHTTSLIRREHFPGFDENVRRLQDWDLWLTMLSLGHTGFWIDEVLYKVNTGGTMSSWLPSFIYKLMPFLPSVKKYMAAAEKVKQKHDLH